MKKLFTKEILKKNIIAVVALIEVIMIAMVSVYAWTETISSLEIKTVKNGKVDTAIKTTANINSADTAINLDGYFKESGNVHLASCSSPDGKNFYFPVISMDNTYRKNNINDKNVNYISFSLNVTAQDKNRTFYFRQAPTIKLNGKEIENTDNCVRMAFFLDDESKGIFSNSQADARPVNSTSGEVTTDTVKINSFSDYTNAEKSLFTVNSGETKTLTVSLWLEDPDRNIDGGAVSVEGLEIITESQKTTKFTFVDRTSAHNDQNNAKVNSWQWVNNYSPQMWLYDGTKSYKMNKDADSEKWTADIKSADYSSSTKITFYRTESTVTDPTSAGDDVWNSWETTYNKGKYTYTAFGSDNDIGTWEDVVEITLKSEDTSVLPTPSADNTAAHISIKYKDNNVEKTVQMCYHNSLWRCYIPKSVSTLDFVAENPTGDKATNADKSTLKQTSLARGNETAYTVTSANTGYWGEGVLVNATVDSSCSGYGTATVKVNVNGTDYEVNNKKVTKGTSVKFVATANSGYSFKEWKKGSTTIKGSSVTATADTELNYVAYFEVVSYTVTAHARIDGASSDSTDGGTVKLKSGGTAGTTAKYTATGNPSIVLADIFTATANSGYTFEGWYDAASGGNQITQITLNKNTDVYARFKANTRKVYFTNNYSWSTVNCFAWNSSTNQNNKAWPGVAMTKSSTNSYGQDIYVIDLPYTYDYIIFNNGSNQTVDIKLPDTGDIKYYISGESNGKYTVGTWS